MLYNLKTNFGFLIYRNKKYVFYIRARDKNPVMPEMLQKEMDMRR